MLGKTLDHYQITSLLGKGGMGEVYRARDTKLGRDVAIKVLPPQMTRDPERVARFRREARTLAALNHTNVASLYGFEDIDGHLFLVMELVEGESLEQMLAGGPLPLQEALHIARQIADGLEEAHENGIVHRDLKPANVMLTDDGRVKVLDFGLARAYQGEGVNESNADISPTITAAMTQAGVILGTAAYMSPEQARGKGVDRRTDLWAFGVLLWEMLTGDRLFLGETISDTLAAILRAEPDWDKLPQDTPEEVKRLIARCLERDQRRRLRDIGEARVRIERWDRDPTTMHAPATGEIHVIPSRSPRHWLPWAVAVLAIATAGYFGLRPHPTPVETSPALALNIDLHLPGLSAPRVNTGPLAILAPKGDRIVYLGTDDFLYAKDLASREVRKLVGTRNAASIAFSPDGDWIAFTAGSLLKRVAFNGGSPIDIIRTEDPRGIDWIDDSTLVFARSYHSGLTVVSLTDNSTRELTALDPASNDRSHRWPQVLPDGTHVLFQVQRLGRSYDRSALVMVDLKTGDRNTIYQGGSFPRYARSGHLVFARERTLFAIAFDLATLQTSGLAAPVLEDVRTFVVDQQNHDGAACYSLSADGSLLYAPAGNQGIVKLASLDLTTGRLTELSEEGDFGMPLLSPDGRMLAAIATQNGQTTLHLVDTKSGLTTPLGLPDATEYTGAWSPDSKYLYWSSADLNGAYSILRQRFDRGDDIATIYQTDNFIKPTSISPDGQHLLLSAFRDSTEWDILELDLATGTVRDFLVGEGTQGNGKYSPDGKWVAYGQELPGSGRTLRIAETANPRRSIPVVDQLERSKAYNWTPASDGIILRHKGAFRLYPLGVTNSQLKVGTSRILQREDFVSGRDFATADIQNDLSRAIVLIAAGDVDEAVGENCDILVTDWFAELNVRVSITSP